MKPSDTEQLFFKITEHRAALAVQWLGLCVFTAGALGSIPGPGTKMPQAKGPRQEKKKSLNNFQKGYADKKNKMGPWMRYTY